MEGKHKQIRHVLSSYYYKNTSSHLISALQGKNFPFRLIFNLSTRPKASMLVNKTSMRHVYSILTPGLCTFTSSTYLRILERGADNRNERAAMMVNRTPRIIYFDDNDSLCKNYALWKIQKMVFDMFLSCSCTVSKTLYQGILK